MTTQIDTAETIIIEALLIERAKSLTERLNNKQYLIREIKYNQSAFNMSLKEDIDWMRSILQSVVDKFYFNYYEVPGFACLSIDNLDYSIAHNMGVINSFNKLMSKINN